MSINVYLLPGFLGCSLHTTTPNKWGGNPDGSLPDLWLNVPRISIGAMYDLALDTDGVTPLAPKGSQMAAGEHVLGYYEQLKGAIATGPGARAAGLVPIEADFDWRLDMRSVGRGLAATIIAGNSDFGQPPCKIVGHSQGGIIARWAWYYLGLAGKQALVDRIITLGTPHRGLMNSVSVFRGVNSTISKIAAYAFSYGHEQLVTGKMYANVPLQAVAGTWPSMYQIFPVYYYPNGDRNGLTQQLAFGENWPVETGVQNAWLDDWRQNYLPVWLSSATMPPREVLTTVAGVGYRTVVANSVGVTNGDFFADLYARVIYFADGDDSVTRDSALVPGVPNILVDSDHIGLQEHPWVLGMISSWLLDVRTPITPPPPDVIAPASQMPPFDPNSLLNAVPLIQGGIPGGGVWSPLTRDP